MNKKYLIKKYNEFCEKYPYKALEVSNGAGPSGKGKWVRDTLFYKFNVTDAANVHDFVYSKYGPKEAVRKDADDAFLEIMLEKLKTHQLVSKTLNKPLVYAYYTAVRVFGGSFYTKQKIDW